MSSDVQHQTLQENITPRERATDGETFPRGLTVFLFLLFFLCVFLLTFHGVQYIYPILKQLFSNGAIG